MMTTQPQPTDVQLEPRTDFAVDVAERIIERLQGAVAEIRALHSWTPDHVDHRTGMWVDICDICHVEHPCPTVQILNEAGRP